MKIYNYLYYKTFLLAKKSKNFEDIPVLGGIMFLMLCVMFNLFALILFIEGLGFRTGLDFKPEYKYPFCIGLVCLLLFYYSYKGRYKKIVEYYENRKDKGINIHPIIVIIFYLIVSFGLLLLAGLFKNRDWIFANI